MALAVSAREAFVSATSDSTSWSITTAASFSAGDLCLVFVSSDGNNTISESGGPLWTRDTGGIANATNRVTGALFSRVASGSGTLTLSLTATGSEQYSAVMLKITGTSPFLATASGSTFASSQGDSTNSDPANFNPGTSAARIWICSRHGDGLTVATAAPTNYGNLQSRTAGGASGASTNTAERSLTASSDDPGVFTSSTEQWVCLTVAVEENSSQALTPSLFTNSQTFHAATVAPGAITLAPSLFTGANSFYAPAVSYSGPTASKSPSTVTSEQVGLGDTVPWTNPGDAASSDDSYAVATLAAGDASYALRCTDFGFTSGDIPLGATIDGIFVEVEVQQSGDATQSTSPLVYSGSQLGSGLGSIIGAGNEGFTPDGTDTYWPLGGPTDLGGASVTQAMVVDSSFGIDLYFAVPFLGLGSSVSVDHVRMTVYYTTGAGGAQALAPSLVTNSQTFHAPTVTRGTVTLTPSLATNNASFFAPTVSGLNTLALSLVTSANAFFVPTVTAGAVNLAPSLATNSSSFFDPAVTGNYALATSLHSNSQTFFSPSVLAGPVTLAPSLVTNFPTFPTATVDIGPVTLSPGLLANVNQFFAAAAASTITLTPELLSSSQSFFAPSVTAIYNLFPPLLSGAQAFYSAVTTVSPVALFPALLANTNYFYGPYIEGEGLTILFAVTSGQRSGAGSDRPYRSGSGRSYRSGSGRSHV